MNKDKEGSDQSVDLVDVWDLLLWFGSWLAWFMGWITGEQFVIATLVLIMLGGADPTSKR